MNNFSNSVFKSFFIYEILVHQKEISKNPKKIEKNPKNPKEIQGFFGMIYNPYNLLGSEKPLDSSV